MKRLTAPLMDTIDKINYHEFIQSSVIKRYNVNYIPNNVHEEVTTQGTTEEMEEDSFASEFPNEQVQSREEIKALEKAEEIFQRLQREAQMDEKAKEAEWTEKVRHELEEERRHKREEGYNATTGSYSGLYGQGEVSDEAQEMMDRIKVESNMNAVEHLVESLNKQVSDEE